MAPRLSSIQVEGLDELLRGWERHRYASSRTHVANLPEGESGAPIDSIDALLESGQYHEALEARYRSSLETAGDTE